MGDIFLTPISSSQAPGGGGGLHSLATCDTPPHLQQASFLPGSAQPRDTWPYHWHLKHRATSTCSQMRQSTHPTLSLPSPGKLQASASVKRTTAVSTPPKRLYSLHWSPRSPLPHFGGSLWLSWPKFECSFHYVIKPISLTIHF